MNHDVLFFGYGTHGNGGVNHYRTIQPAQTLNANYALHNGKQGISQHHVTQDDHAIHIIQNSMVSPHLSLLKQQMHTRAVLVANVDDWVPAVRKQKHHDNADAFQNRRAQRAFDRYLNTTSHAIVSTDWLARRLASRYPQTNIHVCRNMIDAKRYPEPKGLTDSKIRLGFAGASNHQDAITPIWDAIKQLLDEHPHVELHTHGIKLTQQHRQLHHHPWTDIWMYPHQLNQNDVVIAPALDNDYYRAKSQLRLYEAAMLGKAVVAHPMYDESPYTRHASTPDEWYVELKALIDDPGRIVSQGSHQHQWAMDHIVTTVRWREWQDAIDAIRAAETL